MSDNKNYYYLKLKDNYFDQDSIKLLEAMPKGDTFSLIIIKLYLKACKYDGRLMMTDRIPYDKEKIPILAKVINKDPIDVKAAIEAAIELDLITIVEGGQLWMTEIQNYIGLSSTEADRKRAYRRQLESKELVVIGSNGNGQMSGQKSGQMTGQSGLELEKEIELEKEKEKKQAEINSRYHPLSKLLFDLHKKVDPGYKAGAKPEKVYEKWSNDIRLLIENDKRPFGEVELVIMWCKQAGNFWFPNIQSGKKLREKFDILYMQMKKDKSRASPENKQVIVPEVEF